MIRLQSDGVYVDALDREKLEETIFAMLCDWKMNIIEKIHAILCQKYFVII